MLFGLSPSLTAFGGVYEPVFHFTYSYEKGDVREVARGRVVLKIFEVEGRINVSLIPLTAYDALECLNILTTEYADDGGAPARWAACVLRQILPDAIAKYCRHKRKTGVDKPDKEFLQQIAEAITLYYEEPDVLPKSD